MEIAAKELGGSSDEEAGFSQDLRRNGTVVNAQKAGSDDEDEDEEMEDEEIDSDDVLGSDDEFDVMNSKFSQTIRDKKKSGADAYDEEEGGYTSIDEEDLMPLSAVWDMDEAKSSEKATIDPQEPLHLDDEGLSENSSDSEESSESSEEEEEEDPFDEVSGDEDIELNTVAAKLQKETEKSEYRRLDNAAAGEENEYALPAFSNERKKLNLTDMMNAIDDKEAVEKAVLIKGKTEALDVPLPQRIQQRHDRKAAYEISKEQVGKWRDVVQQNRQAEHLSFPMNPTPQHNDGSMFTRSEKSPGTQLEKEVDLLLADSNLADPQKESTFEEIATAKMSPEEMRKRTAELRLMRELMFREERKAKRIKKIKSKAYHRIKKKEMLKNQELIEESDESDREAHDVARARERMSLKHKTTSKWAKDMVKHGMTKDKETREEMEEMLRQGERLRAKMVGHESGSESDSGLSDIERDESLAAVPQETEVRENLGKSGVMNMAFMKNAEARRAEANNESIRKLRAMESGADAFLSDDNERDGGNGANVNINSGRRVYAPGTEESKSELLESNETLKKDIEEDNARSLTGRMSKAGTKNKKGKKKASASASNDEKNDEEKAEINPWLNDDESHNVKKSSKVRVVDESSSRLAKSANKIAKEKSKRESKSSGKGARDDELLLDVDSTNKMQLVDPYAKGDEDVDGFIFKQQDIIAEAFAGDDVVDKFEQEKKRVAIDEDDKVEDVTLPGWGDWAGAGAAPTKRRKFKTVKGTVAKDKRKDKHLKNVIVNEKVNKKNLKYQSSAVPFPFESREQYERSLRMPLGQEWTSRTAHQRMIKPRILTKPGTVIDPLKAPFK